MLLESCSATSRSRSPSSGASRPRTQPGRAADLEQHARADRGAQAPLPVPVARLPRRSSTSWRSSSSTRPSSATTSRASSSRSSRMVRELDLKKPPSIAESIDWARALLLLGADDIDAQVFRDTMSVIVKHRTDLDVVAERVGVKLGSPPSAAPARADGGARQAPPARARPRVRRGAARARASPVGTSELLDAFAVLREVAVDRARATSARRWPRRWPSRPEDRRDLRARLRPLLLPRRRDGRGRARASREGGGDRTPRTRGELEPRDAAPADRRGAARRRGGPDARPRAAGDRRLRPPGRGLGRHRRRRPAHPPRARPARRAAARPAAGRPARATACRASSIRRFEALLRRELERAPDRAHRDAAARAAAERARPRAAERAAAGPRRRAPRRRAAQAPAEDAGPGEPRAQAPRPRRRAPHDARVAGDRRRARSSCATARCARGGRRSTCCATSRPAVTSASRLLPLACCTRCTTRFARCARSSSSSASAR